MTKKVESAYLIRVGSFVVITFIIFTGVIIMLSGKFGMFARTISVRAYFSDVGGLLKGAPVYFSGVEVGKVKDVRLVSPEKVEVIMKIGVDEAKKIPSDSVATLRTMGVLGDVVVEIERGEALEPLTDGMSMRGEALKTIPQAFRVFEDLAKRMTEVAQSLNKITTSISEGKGTVGKLIVDPELYNRLLSMVSRLESASKEIENIVRTLKEEKVAMKVSETFEKLDRVSENLEKITETLNSKEGTVGKLFREDVMYEELRKTVKELRELISDIKKNPKKYLTIKIF